MRDFNVFAIKGLLVSLLVGIALSCRDAAAASPLKSVELAVAGDSLRVRPVFKLVGTLDTAVVSVTVAGVTKRLTVNPPAVGAEFRFAPPAQGATVTVSVSITSYNKGVAGPTTTSSRSYTRPVTAPPAPVIDSITVEIIQTAMAAATYRSDVAVLRDDQTCPAEWAELDADHLVIRAKGTPPAWCHEYLVTDTLRSTQAQANWQAVRFAL